MPAIGDDDGRGHARSWRSELGHRLRRLWLVKASFTTIGIAGFFVAYFWVMHHPIYTPTIMPLTVLDRAIPLEPAALPIYLSLWFYVSLAPALLKTRRELTSYALATTVLSGLGLACFILWPTAVPAFDVDWALYPSMAFLKDTDLALNACPSMHVAFAVYTAMWLSRVFKEMSLGPFVGALNLAWCAAIVYSTIATRQHVVIDVAAGALLGWLVAAIHLRAVPQLSRPRPTRASS